MEGCAFANFGNSSGTEGEPSQKREKNEEKNRTRDPSITDQMSVLTNQVHLKIQFRHRFDQKCLFTDSLHRLGSTRNNFWRENSNKTFSRIFKTSGPHSHFALLNRNNS